jgi:hypothetical protein
MAGIARMPLTRAGSSNRAATAKSYCLSLEARRQVIMILKQKQNW